MSFETLHGHAMSSKRRTRPDNQLSAGTALAVVAFSGGFKSVA